MGTDPIDGWWSWARPADQKAIKSAVEEMTQREPPETAPRVVVYTTDAATATAALTGLRGMFPAATFSAGADPSQVVAFARPDDHEAIKVAIDEMAKKVPAELARQVVVYTVPARATAGSSGSSARIPGAPALMTMLRPMFPDAQFTVGSNRAKLIVWARPADHTAIKKALDEMTKKDPPELAPRVEIYALESTPAASAVPILTAMFPEAQFSVGGDPNKVVALARPADHELIKQAAAQMSKKESPEQARQVAVYIVPMTTGAGSSSSSSSSSYSSKQSGAAALIPTLKTMFPRRAVHRGFGSHAARVMGPAGRPGSDQEGRRRDGQAGARGNGAQGGGLQGRCGHRDGGRGGPEDHVPRQPVRRRRRSGPGGGQCPARRPGS